MEQSVASASQILSTTPARIARRVHNGQRGVAEVAISCRRLIQGFPLFTLRIENVGEIRIGYYADLLLIRGGPGRYVLEATFVRGQRAF